jgi:Arf-GAP/SH3 domain/ANK repeat/PH domain-containing protein
MRRKEDAVGAAPVDTIINGLTFIIASNARELDNLVTREFHADPNLHKNPNVNLVGDYSTNGSPAVQFEWTWHWKPALGAEERGNAGWRNTCSVGARAMHRGYVES